MGVEIKSLRAFKKNISNADFTNGKRYSITLSTFNFLGWNLKTPSCFPGHALSGKIAGKPEIITPPSKYL